MEKKNILYAGVIETPEHVVAKYLGNAGKYDVIVVNNIPDLVTLSAISKMSRSDLPDGFQDTYKAFEQYVGYKAHGTIFDFDHDDFRNKFESISGLLPGKRVIITESPMWHTYLRNRRYETLKKDENPSSIERFFEEQFFPRPSPVYGFLPEYTEAEKRAMARGESLQQGYPIESKKSKFYVSPYGDTDNTKEKKIGKRKK